MNRAFLLLLILAGCSTTKTLTAPIAAKAVSAPMVETPPTDTLAAVNIDVHQNTDTTFYAAALITATTTDATRTVSFNWQNKTNMTDAWLDISDTNSVTLAIGPAGAGWVSMVATAWFNDTRIGLVNSFYRLKVSW